MMNTEELNKAVKVLREGGIILYPTDTVWGIGCDATNPDAVAKVYQIKKRSDSKSLVLLASDVDMICKYIKEIPEIAMQLIEVNDKPMTIIYPDALTGRYGLAENAGWDSGHPHPYDGFLQGSLREARSSDSVYFSQYLRRGDT